MVEDGMTLKKAVDKGQTKVGKIDFHWEEGILKDCHWNEKM